MGERTKTDLKPLPFSGGDEMEINDYDRVRKITPFKEGKSLPIGARTLSTEMSCPICLDLLSQTMTAKECLHRFCSECITMALQRGNKECPTCRKKLVSKRSLRPDPSFDLLISKVWPDRSIYENLQLHELEAREESPESGEVVEGPDGAPLPKKKKTAGYDPESLMEYFLAQQNKRKLAEEEEFPELNGEQAFLEREEIDNLLDNGGGTMQEYEEYNEDDDVYGDELDFDESGNMIESHKNQNHANNNKEPPPEEQGPETSGDYDPYAYTEDNEEVDYDDYEPFDSMGALTPEQQEELQQELDELEAIEYEDFELDFSDEEQPDEKDLAFDPDNDNGIRCSSSSEDDESSDEDDDEEETEGEDEEEEVEVDVEEDTNGSKEASGTEDSSPDSSATNSPKENLTVDESPQDTAIEEEIDRDATPPAYAPEMDEGNLQIDERQANLSPFAISEGGAKMENKSLERPAVIPLPPIPPKIEVAIPSSLADHRPGELEPVQFTPPREDEDDEMQVNMGGSNNFPPPGLFSGSDTGVARLSLESHLGITSMPPHTSVIAIASVLPNTVIKEERLSPSPPEQTTPSSSDIAILEDDDETFSDSTTTTYSSSGLTSSTSAESSDVSFEIDWSDDDEPPPGNAVPADVTTITEGDVQFPQPSTSSMNNNQGSSSYKGVSGTSLTAFSEDLPPHREVDPDKMEEEPTDEIRPPSSTIPSTDRLSHWLANTPSSPQSVDEDMAIMPQRRGDDCDMLESVTGSEEIEAELLPASSLLQRECPEELLIPRYVRTKHDTKMEHLAEFIHQRAMEESQSNQTDFDADPVPTIPKPKHFYVFSRNGGHHVKQIFLHETMATALCAMTQGDHLIIFFDIEGIHLRDDKISILDDVVPSHFLNLPTV